MKHQQIPPPDYLKGYVRYFWTLESNGSTASPITFGPMADGCPGIIFQQSERTMFYSADNQPLPGIFLYGQTIKPTQIHSIAKFGTIGVFFYPTALKAIFGLDAHELTDTCIDLNAFSQKESFFLSERLLNASSTAAQIEVLSSYLLARIRKNSLPADALTQYAWGQIMQSKGSLSLRELLSEVRLSERSLERKFNQSVGVSPKLFSRVCRFQASLHQLRTQQYTHLSDIAFDNGYADQSHFIRTFKELSGFSPYQYRKKINEVVTNFPQLVK